MKIGFEGFFALCVWLSQGNYPEMLGSKLRSVFIKAKSTHIQCNTATLQSHLITILK